MYIRVEDPTSGHQFDRPDDDPMIADGTLKPITSKRWPPSDVVRPPLHHIPKTPASRPDQSAPSTEAPQDATEKE